jgi:hypothetical protein
MPLMSVNEYARHRNVTHQAVGIAVNAGRIKKERNGKIDSEKADASWALRTDTVLSMRNVPRDRPAAATHKPTGTTQGDQARRDTPDPWGGLSGMDVGDKIAMQTRMAKLQLVRKQVELAQIELDKSKGAVMPTVEVQEFIASLILMVRDHFLVQPDRLAPAIAAVNDTATVHRIIKTDVDAALKKLSKAVKSIGF